MNLYQIKNEYLTLASQLEQGELTPEIEQQLQINEEQLKEKAINYGYVIRSFEYDNDVIDAEIKRLKQLKEQKENAIDKLKNAVSDAIQLYGIEKIDSPTLKLSFRKSESIEVSDNLDKKYLIEKITMQPDKQAIKKDIKDGKQVEGALLVTNYNIQIK